MLLCMILLLTVGCCIQITEGLEDIDKNLDFFKTSYNKTVYGGVKFGNMKKFYKSLCNYTTRTYALTSAAGDKLNEFIRSFPPDYDPDLYLPSYQCERNDAFYFICERMFKTQVPHKEQRWYTFRVDNTPCSFEGITILSGVGQILENKHFFEITVGSVLQRERRDIESWSNESWANVSRVNESRANNPKSINQSPDFQSSSTSALTPLFVSISRCLLLFICITICI